MPVEPLRRHRSRTTQRGGRSVSGGYIPARPAGRSAEARPCFLTRRPTGPCQILRTPYRPDSAEQPMPKGLKMPHIRHAACGGLGQPAGRPKRASSHHDGVDPAMRVAPGLDPQGSRVGTAAPASPGHCDDQAVKVSHPHSVIRRLVTHVAVVVVGEKLLAERAGVLDGVEPFGECGAVFEGPECRLGVRVDDPVSPCFTRSGVPASHMILTERGPL
jgi:hypothetical protein